MKVIIAGGRDYDFGPDDRDWLARVAADASAAGRPITEIIHGAATGADHSAHLWAREHRISITEFPADWGRHGRAAGPIRNRQMATYAGPDAVCILFPGGRGTANMKAEAIRAGIVVIERSKGS